MDYEAKSLGRVESLGEVFQLAVSLPEQILAFKRKGIAWPYLADSAEVVQIRMAGFSNDFSRTSVAPIAVNGEKTILYRPSPLMHLLMARRAVSEHRNGNYLSLPRWLYEEAKEIANAESGKEPEDRTAIVLSQASDYDLTPEMDEVRFLLGKNAKPYFEKFGHSKILFYNLSTDSKDVSVINYLWFDGPEGGSGLGCGGRGLGSDIGAFGVFRKAAEGGAAQNSRYDITEIKDANSEVIPRVFEGEGVPRLIEMLKGPLNKALLEKLRGQ